MIRDGSRCGTVGIFFGKAESVHPLVDTAEALRVVMAALPVVIIVVDDQGDVVWRNEA
nr:hypothetical protein GCM10020092_054110 [Actinoplanes digitatis]